ncbi:Ribokinase-like protein [Xylaria bambusicola]|uniref:Ribokinase-like protein n=1 Tax=Xylaria bambusicola TaxID=326684 RepID=UPI0020081AD2|nr:Ribokinase-like protein [Xylaria bambusicola]KAI0521269.1 Ribokinase-like protein [Xylaria bambusicola]
MDQNGANAAPERYPVFVSMGMTILDELRFSHQRTAYDVPGGSGLFAVLGARLFKPSPHAADVGCVLAAGCDLPGPLLSLLKSWQLTLLVLTDPEKPCTRGLLEYLDDGFGGTRFSYTTSPLRPETIQLDASILLYSKSFHFLALPHDLENQVKTLLRLRAEHGITERPMIVWEPAPMGCDSINLESHIKASALVDVLSPNHIELHRLFNGKSEKDIEFSQSSVEMQASRFVEAGIGPDRQGVLVVRAGYHGAMVLSSGKQPEWLPAYYGKDVEEVVDATGAGNAFLGAFAVAFQETKDAREACLRGAVAASYAIEQHGPPTLTAPTSESGELWNESDVLSRLDELKARSSTA